MSYPKYFNPGNYFRYIRNRIINLRIRYGAPMPVWVEALNEKICFVVSSEKEYWMRSQLSYEAEKTTMYWIENIIKKDDVIYDVGANVGAYSLLIGKKISSKGALYSFEPESANYFSLNRNIVTNNLSQKITAICMGFDEIFKIDKFYLSSLIPGSATHSVGKPESEGVSFDPLHEQGIITMSIDEFVALAGVKFPNHLKIDVDGNEGLIVRGARKTLADERLKTLVIEISENVSQGQVEKMIKEYGLVEKKKEVWESDGPHGTILNYLYGR